LRLLTARHAHPGARRTRAGSSGWTIGVLCISGLIGSDIRAAGAQSIAITGRTIDAVSGRAVAGAQVTLASSTVVTDAQGRFQFDISAGRWEIVIPEISYTPRGATESVSLKGPWTFEVDVS